MTLLHRYAQNNSYQSIESGQTFESSNFLDENGIIELFVWNIFKQKRKSSLALLDEYLAKQTLILLQESLSKSDLTLLIKKSHKIADHVPAYAIKGIYSGVMTIAHVEPLQIFSFKIKEPLIRIPKSALITYYRLSTNAILLVVNIHSINFSLGTKKYNEQIKLIGAKIKEHQGPMIIAGDFNAWSRKRLYLLYSFTRKMNLKPVYYGEDLRKHVFGMSLDFIFYRGLEVEQASNLKTDASDHNPMLVKFRVKS